MKKDLNRKRGVIQFLIIVGIASALMTANYRSQGESFVGSLFFTLFSPIQGAITSTYRKTTETVDHYFFLLGVELENKALKNENDRLNFENSLLKEKVLKLKRITRLHQEERSIGHEDLLLANVVGYDASGWARLIVIDRGSKEGVKKNMAVITYKGLAGRVVETTKSYSKVLLITDARSSIDAILQRDRGRGVVTGRNKEFCEIQYLSVNSDVRPGDRIVSSGLGGTIPKGLVVGSVLEVSKENDGLFKRVTLKPASDLDRLEEVFVVLKERKRAAEKKSGPGKQ